MIYYSILTQRLKEGQRKTTKALG